MNQMNDVIKTSKLQHQQSVRPDNIRGLTSAYGGKIIPVAYAPMLREDRLASSRINVQFEMMETAELLMNPVNVTMHAYFVPYTAFERFNGREQLDRSYMGIPAPRPIL